MLEIGHYAHGFVDLNLSCLLELFPLRIQCGLFSDCASFLAAMYLSARQGPWEEVLPR